MLRGISGPSSSCVWNPRVFADDARGWQCPFVLGLPPHRALTQPWGAWHPCPGRLSPHPLHWPGVPRLSGALLSALFPAQGSHPGGTDPPNSSRRRVPGAGDPAAVVTARRCPGTCRAPVWLPALPSSPTAVLCSVSPAVTRAVFTGDAFVTLWLRSQAPRPPPQDHCPLS